jgi:NTP pyrophosphatase (non-canonical NTP hydrolase)
MNIAQLFSSLKQQMNINGGMNVALDEQLNNQKSSDTGINQLCKKAFETAKSKGWHEQPREMGTILCLIHGEVSEAMEADRRGEGRDRVTEELADVCIRIFDLCGSMNLDLEKAIKEKMEFNKSRPYKHGGKSY